MARRATQAHYPKYLLFSRSVPTIGDPCEAISSAALAKIALEGGVIYFFKRDFRRWKLSRCDFHGIRNGRNSDIVLISQKSDGDMPIFRRHESDLFFGKIPEFPRKPFC